MLTPVSTLVSVTVVFATAAPDGSVMDPWMSAALVWANVAAVSAAAQTAAR
jgi:head-tail adaptor